MNKTSSTIASLTEGALAGTLATIPMTAVMVVSHRLLPHDQRYPLPPQLIIEDLADTAEAELILELTGKQPTVWTAHIAYGALMGAIYGGLKGNKRVENSVARGICFGLGVWAANYLVGLPVFGMRASAPNEPAPRDAMMIGSHIVWGGVMGKITQQLNSSNSAD